MKSRSQGRLKAIKELYVDMTFFTPDVASIPTREESVRELLKFLDAFLNTSEHRARARATGHFHRFVYMKTSARIGYEYVYQEVYRAFGWRVHVNELIYKIYDQLPLIQDALTRDPHETPVHACIYENRKRCAARTDLMTAQPFAPCSSNNNASCSSTSSPLNNTWHKNSK